MGHSLNADRNVKSATLAFLRPFGLPTPACSRSRAPRCSPISPPPCWGWWRPRRSGGSDEAHLHRRRRARRHRVRRHLLAVRLPAHGHGCAHRAGARRRRRGGAARRALTRAVACRYHRCSAGRAAGAARLDHVRSSRRQRRGAAGGADLLLRAHLVGALHARQSNADRLAHRHRARHHGADAADRGQRDQHRAHRAVRALARFRHRGRRARSRAGGGSRIGSRACGRLATLGHDTSRHRPRSCSSAASSCACSSSIATS